MLDQNTDRMWYVIGAVIVGAAIIFLVNSSFPQLFASVTDTFQKSADNATSTITDIKNQQNILNRSGEIVDTHLFIPTSELRPQDAPNDNALGGSIEPHPAHGNSTSDFIAVTPGETLKFIKFEKPPYNGHWRLTAIDKEGIYYHRRVSNQEKWTYTVPDTVTTIRVSYPTSADVKIYASR